MRLRAEEQVAGAVCKCFDCCYCAAEIAHYCDDKPEGSAPHVVAGGGGGALRRSVDTVVDLSCERGYAGTLKSVCVPDTETAGLWTRTPSTVSSKCTRAARTCFTFTCSCMRGEARRLGATRALLPRQHFVPHSFSYTPRTCVREWAIDARPGPLEHSKASHVTRARAPHLVAYSCSSLQLLTSWIQVLECTRGFLVACCKH